MSTQSTGNTEPADGDDDLPIEEIPMLELVQPRRPSIPPYWPELAIILPKIEGSIPRSASIPPPIPPPRAPY